ncbi:phage shock protein PspD [Enterobacillus tribolii]|uniref:Phage shock protein D n=1 Tax=Enterobacillus tribolii TaxID=1487935 RepID=A0A370R4E9_9GAMM|nr:phage shock protein PspD [Enterobacillus tribolii]RDK96965.1 phage shock protein D [Enterobacillus tribolii]
MSFITLAKSGLPRLLRQGLLLGLTLAPAGIAAGALRFITYRPLRWLIVWGLEPLLQRGFQRAAARYRARDAQNGAR